MKDWTIYLAGFKPSYNFRHEMVALRVCELAFDAAQQGTYGVGAVLIDDHGDMLIEGHNEVFGDSFRSDLHAEMVVLNKLETSKGRHDRVRDFTLVSSLEPCPMCMTRLIFSGVGTILYLRQDDIGGMVHKKDALPPVFQELTERQGQVWALAECSEQLREAAFQIWDESRQKLDDLLVG